MMRIQSLKNYNIGHAKITTFLEELMDVILEVLVCPTVFHLNHKPRKWNHLVGDPPFLQEGAPVRWLGWFITRKLVLVVDISYIHIYPTDRWG